MQKASVEVLVGRARLTQNTDDAETNMSPEKPQTISEYRKRLRDCHGVRRTSLSRARYESVADKIRKDFDKSTPWITIRDTAKHLEQKYYLATGYQLFTTASAPELLVKPFDSFLLKTFRKNILQNPNWPDEPEGGWYLPDSWYYRINDIIRTRFVVKYLDGVEFLTDQISVLLADHDCPSHVDFEAKEQGYYAAHLYTEYECEIPGEDWDTETVMAIIEMQVTTQVQDVIGTLLHGYYETRRIRGEDGEQKWQWDYKSDEFAANYLGHILHYVEGMIMDIRERQRRTT